MIKIFSYIWQRISYFLVLLYRQSRTRKLSVVALILTGMFITSVWFPFIPLPVSILQPTACWQPGKSENTGKIQSTTLSNFLPINDVSDALSWRIALIESARKTIDAQYFMWHMDETGLLLLDRLLQAADRGIKVRLLLDDIMGGLDREWALVNMHPNIEVRLFNPFKTRENNWWARAPEWLLNNSRLNHRMHNKLFLVDQKTGIIGGRNISNEYFGLGSHLDYRDFDLLASGPIAYQLDESFATFWNSVWTYSPSQITELRVEKDELETFRYETKAWLAKSEKLKPIINLHRDSADWKQLFKNARKQFIEASAEVIYDCPPGTQSGMPTQRVVTRVKDLLSVTKSNLFVVSPYVVLSSSVRAHVYATLDRGVKIQLLTNSLKAADQNITFSAYSNIRSELLEKGVNIHEMDGNGEHWKLYRTPFSSGKYLSVHAKILLFDDDKLMVGSLNLDPRSKYLNTEIGLFIQSKELTSRIMQQFDRDLTPQNSMRVKLDENGSLYWESKQGKFYDEPARSNFQRLQVFLFSFLPIDSQL